MREDLIHDALNLLDDDLIGEVEFLRSRKKSTSKKWMSWTAMAACMCIVIGSLFAGKIKMEVGQNSESADMENMSDFAGGDEGEVESELPIQAEGLINDEKAENESMREVPAFLVEIVEWKDDGFIGTIAGIVDTDIYPVGTEVYVKLPTSSEMMDVNEIYEIGTLVHVQFNDLDETDGIVLYVDDLWKSQEE